VRADARRNCERIVAAAADVFAREGAEASLEEIARRAGVGSATLHRHFPSRWALLGAVFQDQVGTLCARAKELESADDPGAALVRWLREVGAYAAATRGLAATMLPQAGDNSCHDTIAAAGQALMDRAQAAGAVRPDVSIQDLLTVVNALSMAGERHPGGAAEVDRLVKLALEGVSWPTAPVRKGRSTGPS
jgi:AcrR family transcriptional regulator